MKQPRSRPATLPRAPEHRERRNSERSERIARTDKHPQGHQRVFHTMIIDCHGHYTTSPPQHEAWRAEQIAALKNGGSPPPRPLITDDEIRESIQTGQIRIQRELGPDLRICLP